ncbi:MAG TPA: hypothetical protein VJO33_02425 [Gemmatimonadaceae bacterium]|nr:hypothetical protein [Gemmatimonadaceae bacterium]
MTTRRRLVRDRRRYNAMRRVFAGVVRVLGPWGFLTPETRAALTWPPYNAIAFRGQHGVPWRRQIRWRGWQRCECGRRRQTIRLA